MAEQRYPNEGSEYRAAREALLREERELVEKTKAWRPGAASFRSAAS